MSYAQFNCMAWHDMPWYQAFSDLKGSDFPAPVDHFWATLTKSCPAMTVSVFAFICRSWPLSAKTNRLWKQQWVYLILTLGKRYSSLDRWGTSWSRQVSAQPGTWAQTGAERCAQERQTKCTQWHRRHRRPDTSVSRRLEMGNFGCDCTPPLHKRCISKYIMFISHLLRGIYFQCCWLWTCVCVWARHQMQWDDNFCFSPSTTAAAN